MTTLLKVRRHCGCLLAVVAHRPDGYWLAPAGRQQVVVDEQRLYSQPNEGAFPLTASHCPFTLACTHGHVCIDVEPHPGEEMLATLLHAAQDATNDGPDHLVL